MRVTTIAVSIDHAPFVFSTQVFPTEAATESSEDNRRDVVLFTVIGILGGLVLAICIIFTCTGCILLRLVPACIPYTYHLSRLRLLSRSWQINLITKELWWVTTAQGLISFDCMAYLMIFLLSKAKEGQKNV